MSKKDKLVRQLRILDIILTIIGLISGIAYIILQSKIGWENGWTQFTLCLTIICYYEIAYSSGYLRGMNDYPTLSLRFNENEDDRGEK